MTQMNYISGVCEYWTRISTTLYYAGPEAMRKGVHQVLPWHPAILYQELSSKFKSGKHSKRFNNGEKDILFPTGKTETDSANFDVTLCFKLYDNLQQIGYSYQGKMFPPRTGLKYEYGNIPSLTTATVSDALQLLKDFRNTIFHRVDPISEAEFKQQWSFLVQLLNLLGYNTNQIANLEKGSLDETALVQLSKFKSIIDHFENKIKNVSNQSTQSAKDLSDVQNDLQAIKKQFTDFESNSNSLMKATSEDFCKLRSNVTTISQKIAVAIKHHNEKLKALERSVEGLKNEDDENKKRIDFVEKKSDSNEKRIGSIEKKLEALGEPRKSGTK